MAYTPCAGNLALNIANSCDKPIVAGYTGRAVLFRAQDLDYTLSLTDKRMLTMVSSYSGNAAIDNVGYQNPFEGTEKTKTLERGLPLFHKTFVFKAPLRGSQASKKVFEAIAESADGYVAVLEKIDSVGNGSFEVIGFENPLRQSADGYSKSEYANGGAAQLTLETWERGEEYVFLTTDYASALSDFNDLFTEATPA